MKGHLKIIFVTLVIVGLWLEFRTPASETEVGSEVVENSIDSAEIDSAGPETQPLPSSQKVDDGRQPSQLGVSEQISGKIVGYTLTEDDQIIGQWVDETNAERAIEEMQEELDFPFDSK